MRKIYRKGVFLVVFLKKKRLEYLLLHRILHWNGWEFPKGGIEKERIENAVRRETKEESGLKVKRIFNFKKKGRFNYNRELPDRKGIKGQTWRLFAVEVEKCKVKIDKIEHDDYKWLNFKEAYKLLTWKDQRECLKIVNKFLKREL